MIILEHLSEKERYDHFSENEKKATFVTQKHQSVLPITLFKKE